MEAGLKGIGALVVCLTVALAFSRCRAWRAERTSWRAEAPVGIRCAPGQTDLNRATLKQLMAVSGIGPVLAQEIIRYREQQGPFRRVEELVILRGVSARKLRHLSPQLCVEEERPREAN
jgi:competence ComEA-like helix-hairpin-helix protein